VVFLIQWIVLDDYELVTVVSATSLRCLNMLSISFYSVNSYIFIL